jgi:urease accessory protein
MAPASMTSARLAGLLQLASPTLPVGAFSYSQGLEWAVSEGIVHDEASLEAWLESVLRDGIAAWDATWIAALMRAWSQGALDDVTLLNERFLASRETRELLAETLQMGRSLLALLANTRELAPARLAHLRSIDVVQGLALPVAWSALAAHRDIAIEDALVAYLWAWLENGVMAALKTAPIGQSAGQRLLTRLGATLDALAAEAAARPLDRCCNLLPGLTLASMRHETQYTRLFRS